MTTNDTLRSIANYLKNNNGFTIIMHIAPDGDTIGSSLALYGALKSLGKRVQVVCRDKMPYLYDFMPYISEVISPDKAAKTETAIAIDCADVERMGQARRLFDAAQKTISIDHHSTNTMFAALNQVDPDAAATGEIVFPLVSELLGGNLSKDIADCLYTAVLTDTGGFAYTNTTARSLNTAAELLQFGVNPSDLNMRIYRTVSLSKTKLLGYALSHIEMFCDNRVGLCIITQEDLSAFRAKAEDTEGIIDHIRNIETVQIAIFIRECLDGDYKVSLRSKDIVNVAAFAQNHGGGGHPCAAGFKTNMSLNPLIDMMLTDVSRLIKT